MAAYVVIAQELDEHAVLAVHGPLDTFDAAMARAEELAHKYAKDSELDAAADVEEFANGYCVALECAFEVKELSA